MMHPIETKDGIIMVSLDTTISHRGKTTFYLTLFGVEPVVNIVFLCNLMKFLSINDISGLEIFKVLDGHQLVLTIGGIES